MNKWAEERKAARKAKVAEVKALSLKPGDWVAKGVRNTHIFRAYPELLDARKAGFVLLRRATPEEIESRSAGDKRRDDVRMALERERSRPEYKLASRFANTDVDVYLKLSLEKLQQIEAILDEVQG